MSSNTFLTVAGVALFAGAAWAFDTARGVLGAWLAFGAVCCGAVLLLQHWFADRPATLVALDRLAQVMSDELDGMHKSHEADRAIADDRLKAIEDRTQFIALNVQALQPNARPRMQSPLRPPSGAGPR